ncbi:MAG: hypothetical protein CMP48_20720 [Rickettsiales bacterium]|nr:hypothetical protein [Rickettsiales bacterium]
MLYNYKNTRTNDIVKIRILFPLIIFLFSSVLIAQESLPKLETRVTDQTGTLTSSEISSLENKLKSYEDSKGSQVVVVLIPTTGDETIEQYSIRLAEAWKIGRNGVDDGVIMLFAMQDRKMRIEVGYGLEGALTDALSKRIITNVITPDFRSGHFYSGIDSGVDVVLSAIAGEELPPAVREETSSSDPFVGLGAVILIIGVVFLIIVKSIMNKKLGKGRSTGIMSVIVFLVSWLLLGFGAAIFITAIVSIFMAAPSGGRGGRGGGGMYWGGGGGFSGGGGGWSGGGFSGGGGGFGGGGASGGW